MVYAGEDADGVAAPRSSAPADSLHDAAPAAADDGAAAAGEFAPDLFCLSQHVRLCRVATHHGDQHGGTIIRWNNGTMEQWDNKEWGRSCSNVPLFNCSAGRMR